MDIGSADLLALHNLQIPERSTNRTLHTYSFPLRYPDRQRLTPSCLDTTQVVSTKRINSWYPLRSEGEHRGNREHSAPATATQPASKVRPTSHPSQLLQEYSTPRRHIHLQVVRTYTVKPLGLRSSLRPPSSSTAIYVTIFQGPQLKLPFVLSSAKLALKLHAHSVQYACKLARTRRALEKTSYQSQNRNYVGSENCNSSSDQTWWIPEPDAFEMPSASAVSALVSAYVGKMNSSSSPGFDNVAAPFLKTAMKLVPRSSGRGVDHVNVLVKERKKYLRLPFGRVHLGKSLPMTPTDRVHPFLHPGHKDSIRGPPPCCRPPRALPGLRNMTVAELDVLVPLIS
eukprot:1138286-Pelagomonas_calceolata.AAC.2